MNCNDCKNEMYQLSDETADPVLIDSLHQHINSCSDCTAEYEAMNKVLLALQVKADVKAPLFMKEQIINQLNKKDIVMEKNTAPVKRFSPLLKRMLAAAAIIAGIIMVIPFFNKGGSTGNAATNYFQNAIDATATVKSMVVHFSIKTDEKDNFEMFGNEFPMVSHTATKLFDKPEKWRVEKPGRTVVCDGSNQYLWVPSVQQAIKGPSNAGFVSWLKILLDPATILMKEQEEVKASGSVITYKEEGDKQIVTIVSKAQGNFLNDYLKNTSIKESDNKREYTFDKNSKLLKGLKVWLLNGKIESLVFSIDDISYNNIISGAVFAITLPAGVDWQSVNTNVSNETLANVDSKRAAELIFDGLAKNHIESTKEAWTQFNFITIKIVKNKYGGLQVLKIGESFKSGLYPGEFVPYEIKLADGTVKNAKLALRNDNKNKVWVVDGGM